MVKNFLIPPLFDISEGGSSHIHEGGRGAEPSNFRQQVEPEIDGGKISLLAKVNEEAEESFPSAAAALLFAIGWPRAFGLDMIEAMTSDGLHNCDIEEEAKRWARASSRERGFNA